MGQTVYADLYFMINFSMDFLCLFLAAKMLSMKLNVFRMLLAAALGGVYAVIALLLTVGRLWALVIDMAVCALLCAVAFAKKKQWRESIMFIPVYIAVSMVLGGFMTALFNLFNRLDFPLPEGDGDGMSIWLFAILAILGGFSVLFGGRFFARKGSRKNAEVTVTYKGKSVSVRALCDSGNLLRDPVNQSLCIVVDRAFLKGVIPDEALFASRSGNISALSSLERENSARIRLIPVNTATGEGILVAFRVDSVEVDSGKGKRRVEALIVASNIEKTADGSHALIPPELL
jgi:stage II sporulation protein GA (sporulation sigma-E factor processing peptidase)